MSQLHHSGQFLPSKSSEWKLTVGWDIFMSSVGNKKSRPFLSRSSTWRTMMMKMMKVKTMNVQGVKKTNDFWWYLQTLWVFVFFGFAAFEPTTMDWTQLTCWNMSLEPRSFWQNLLSPWSQHEPIGSLGCTNRRGQVSNPFYKWTSFHYRNMDTPFVRE